MNAARLCQRQNQRGAALMLALWLVLLLSGLMAVFALSARTESLQASALRHAVAARYAAEGGVEVAVLHLLTPDTTQRWLADGRPYRFVIDARQIEVSVRDESGKLDLNIVTIEQLTRLLVVLGSDEQRAARIAGAVADWRDSDDLLSVNGAEDNEYADAELPYGAKDQPFVTLSEFQQVLGMDEALFRLAAPHLTVYSGEAMPRLFSASVEVLQAMGLAPAFIQQLLAQRAAWQPGMPPLTSPDGSQLAADGTGTYSISSRALRPEGAALEITATVRVGNGLLGQLYTPLAWRVGDAD